MGAHYMFTDKDNKSFDLLTNIIQNNGCWGFLKSLKQQLTGLDKAYKSYLTLSKENREGYPAQYRNNTLHLNGIPRRSYEELGFIRVYNRTFNTSTHKKLCCIKGLAPMFEQLPKWFGEWELHFDEENKEDYFLIPLETSGLRAYNALRFFRNLQNVTAYDASEEDALTRLTISQLRVSCVSTRILIAGRADGISVPTFELHDIHSIIKAIDDGPIIEDNHDEPLGALTSEYANKTRFPFNRAFIKDYKTEMRGGQYGPTVVTNPLDPAIPRTHEALVEYIRDAVNLLKKTKKTRVDSIKKVKVVVAMDNLKRGAS